MRFRAIVILAALCLSTQTAGTPQDPARPQFRTGVEVRRLDVVVVDRDGRPVRGLTAADFTILEDGKPQKISTIEEIAIPEAETVHADWMRDVASDVRTNDMPVDGRLMVIVIDDAMSRDPQLIEPTKRIGREIVNHLGPSDLAAVVYTMENHKSQDFTSDRQRLLAAIERMRTGFDSRSAAAMLGPKYSVQTLSKAAEYLRSIEGRRKTLIYVSVGVPVDWDDISTPILNLGQPEVTVDAKEAMRDIGEDLQGALSEAQLSNVAVYAISPRGLTVEDHRLESDFLETMSANTGGFAIVNTNAPEARVPEIFTATSAYYLIGYEVQKQDDGRFRRLEVKVSRPGLTVHARKGYVAPRTNSPAKAKKPGPGMSPLATAMAGFLPKGDVPMQVTALPFALPGRSEAGVAIVARVQQPPVTKRTVQRVELLTTAFDTAGKARASRRQTARVTMLPSDTSVATYEVLSRIDLKPGRYNLRIAAHNPAVEKSGSVFYDIDVPDFRKDGLWLSGAALTVSPGIASAPRGALSELNPVVPSTIRDFMEDDEVHGYIQVTQGGRSAVRAVTLDIRVIDGTDTVVHRASDTLETAMFSAVRSADYQFRLPVEQLKPGAYLLTIEATAGGRSARRDVRFARR